jgi:molybdenum cofactor biosynthesis protein B
VSVTRTPATDSSGDYLARAVTASGHALVRRRIVNDEAAGIHAAFSDFLASGAQVVISSGGTGIAGGT